ncbi:MULTISPECIES: flagellar biosynthesis regulator FlaF [unclassified Paracoccus (in: a-proteobacteria)]|uniref:flagellar biosynthesis regulator FlaF n=1 Tax=unclassified Paracoccus (in: a-proteobacteria) TaxID=2688777 RepID=UPI0012B1EF78|nr:MULTISPECIES: flagellar biosynthesis regulator FlaF [unclassified Paracoccus (in: a-proteobacteria)]UXU75356.1 flagellar biosynthesis regulator FlaF [Paracoccus sp. SMMA_5]UXU81259.1 flagellar biosynthesis regulator FlaF [Paracoccus sp. SMMA_5_TC]
MSFLSAADAFRDANSGIGTYREIEYKVIAGITRELQTAIRQDDRLLLVKAIDANNRLWSRFQDDLLAAGNRLPQDLKISLLSLARFSLRHGSLVFDGVADADVLVDINLAIMKGLRGNLE